MPNSIKDILKDQNFSLEQKILLDRFDSMFNYDSPGNNKHIVTVTPFMYTGTLGECTIYAATKLYICLKLFAGASGVSAALPIVRTYDETNATLLDISWSKVFYNVGTAAVQYEANGGFVENIWFSRILLSNYSRYHFIGYRVTLD